METDISGKLAVKNQVTYISKMEHCTERLSLHVINKNINTRIRSKTLKLLRNNNFPESIKNKIKLNHTGVTHRIIAIIKAHKADISF